MAPAPAAAPEAATATEETAKPEMDNPVSTRNAESAKSKPEPATSADIPAEDNKAQNDEVAPVAKAVETQPEASSDKP